MSVYQHYQKIATDIHNLFPKGMNSAFQVPSEKWAYLALENAMYRNAVIGMCMSLFFAFLVLLITTANYLVSLQAVLSIMLTIATIMSCIKVAGWSLGIAESIGLVVFVGFSVDYIVHMCHQYVESVFEKR